MKISDGGIESGGNRVERMERARSTCVCEIAGSDGVPNFSK